MYLVLTLSIIFSSYPYNFLKSDTGWSELNTKYVPRQLYSHYVRHRVSELNTEYVPRQLYSHHTHITSWSPTKGGQSWIQIMYLVNYILIMSDTGWSELNTEYVPRQLYSHYPYRTFLKSDTGWSELNTEYVPRQLYSHHSDRNSWSPTQGGQSWIPSTLWSWTFPTLYVSSLPVGTSSTPRMLHFPNPRVVKT